MSRDNWVLNNPFTVESDNENVIFIENAVERFKEGSNTNSTTSVKSPIDFLEEDLSLGNKFEVPNVAINYDVYNRKKYSKKIQRWQGIVISVSEETFTAKLFDLTNGGTYEIGSFYIDEISPADMTIFNIGSVFYWSVGHYMENGQVVNRSDLRFQRLITLDEVDFECVMTEVESKYSNLKERKLD